MMCQISQIQVSTVYRYVVINLQEYSRVAMFYCIFVYNNCHKNMRIPGEMSSGVRLCVNIVKAHLKLKLTE